jgi:hypothetical protein
MVVMVAGPSEALGESVGNLARELGELARDDPRFEHAADLATELKDEIERAMDPSQPAPTRRLVRGRIRRRIKRRAPRAGSSAPPTLEAYQLEYEALTTVIQHADAETGEVLTRRVLDLRLDERTRRVFENAGLHQVQDIASLTAEQAMAIPQLATNTLAELRAAIMFASEIAEMPHQPALPTAHEGEDLFEGVVNGVNELPRRERETVVLRTGTTDRVHTIEEVALVLGVLPDQVSALERHALNLLLSQPGTLDACWRLEALCAQYGLGWDDERLQKVVASLYPSTRANFTRLVAWLMREKGRLVAEAAGRAYTEPRGVAQFDEMVIATIGRYGEMSAEQLTRQMQAALPPADRAMYPEIQVSERVQILGPAVQRDDGMFCLPETPIPDVDDRHIRALNGLIGALQKLGTARISALTSEVNRRLPRQYHINDQYVRTWLTRHPDLFVQSDADRFKLASLDVDILCGLAKSWTPGSTAPAVAVSLGRSGSLGTERHYERVAKEISEFLGREGPQPIWRIRSHLYGRIIGQASADTVVAAYPNQFVRQKSGVVALRGEDDALTEVTEVMSPTSQPRRARLWPRPA